MTPEQIKALIEAGLPGSTAHVMDPMNDGLHLQAIVVSPAFEGLPLVGQHKMVMGLLREALRADVHALGLRTLTPARWEIERASYQL